MNSLKMDEVIYKFQDLVFKKDLTSYEKFKTHFEEDEIKFDKKLRNHRFINNMFKKIYTFLKVLQKNPEKNKLVFALKPMFEMLLNEMVIPKYVRVFDFSENTIFYDIDLTKMWRYNIRRNKKIVQVGYDIFIDYGDSLAWHGLGVDGAFERKRDLNAKRIKSFGYEAYVKEKEEEEERRRKLI